MTIEESKEKLKKEGYTWFELNEFDSEFYEWLKEYKCNEQTSIKDKLKGLRCDFKNIDSNENIQFRNDFETHEEATEKKNELLDFIKCFLGWIFSNCRLVANSYITFPRRNASL
jgi:hypothetical protein